MNYSIIIGPAVFIFLYFYAGKGRLGLYLSLLAYRCLIAFNTSVVLQAEHLLIEFYI